MRRQRTKLTATRYILFVLELVRKDVRFFFAATLAALALRLIFLVHFPGIVDDSRLYADIAMNWLQYGVYGISNSGQVVPTLSRLPGYPAFLAAVFAVFGWSNFRAVLLVQIVFDLGTCRLATRRLADMDKMAPVAGMRSRCRSLSIVAARWRNFARGARSIFVLTFCKRNSQAKTKPRPHACAPSSTARGNYSRDRRARTARSVDLAQSPHPTSIPAACSALCQRLR